MATGYSYRPLKAAEREIRLLSVKAKHFEEDEPLKFRMEHAKFSDDEQVPSYVAVSYVWGDATRRKNIIIDHQNVSVPENAEIALRNLISAARRLSSEDVKRQRSGLFSLSKRFIFWIDAICIDQFNLVERGQQVAIMWRIFSQSAVVLIWLGQDDGSTTKYMKEASSLLEHCRQKTNEFRDFEKMVWDTNAGWKRRLYEHVLALPIHDWSCVDSFFSSPWFERLWVIQETVLATTCFAVRGNHIIPWSEIGRVADWMEHLCYHKHIGRAISGLENAALIEDNRRAFLNLSSLLTHTYDFKVSEPRDRVYGLLGLCRRSDSHVPFLEWLGLPDYSAPIGNIYMKAIRVAIDQDRSLEMLALAQEYADDVAEESAADKFPSWVPRLHQDSVDEAGFALRASQLGRGDNARSADNDTPFAINYTISDPVLQLEGIILDNVEENFVDWSGEMHTPNTLNAKVLRCWGLAERYSFSSVGTLAKTLTLGGKAGLQPTLPAFEQAELITFVEYCQGRRDVTSLAQEVRNYQKYLWRVTYLRRFFVTQTGFIGMAPASLRKGDVVSILFGGHAPFILRPVSERPDFFRLVGDAYVGDVMDGEYVQKLQDEGRLVAETRRINLL